MAPLPGRRARALLLLLHCSLLLLANAGEVLDLAAVASGGQGGVVRLPEGSAATLTCSAQQQLSAGAVLELTGEGSSSGGSTLRVEQQAPAAFTVQSGKRGRAGTCGHPCCPVGPPACLPAHACLPACTCLPALIPGTVVDLAHCARNAGATLKLSRLSLHVGEGLLGAPGLPATFLVPAPFVLATSSSRIVLEEVVATLASCADLQAYMVQACTRADVYAAAEVRGCCSALLPQRVHCGHALMPHPSPQAPCPPPCCAAAHPTRPAPPPQVDQGRVRFAWWEGPQAAARNVTLTCPQAAGAPAWSATALPCASRLVRTTAGLLRALKELQARVAVAGHVAVHVMPEGGRVLNLGVEAGWEPGGVRIYRNCTVLGPCSTVLPGGGHGYGQWGTCGAAAAGSEGVELDFALNLHTAQLDNETGTLRFMNLVSPLGGGGAGVCMADGVRSGGILCMRGRQACRDMPGCRC